MKGSIGWVAIAAGVLAWDLLADETLTDAFRRAHAHPASRVVVVAAWAVLTGHLFGLIPDKADPFYVAYTATERMRHRGLVPVAAGQDCSLA